MADPKVPARRGQVPSVLGDIGRPGDLTPGHNTLGFERGVLGRNTAVVDASTAYLDARRRQSDAYLALIDARVRIASKIAELVDLPNRIAEEQYQREHARWQAQSSRELERLQITFDHKKAIARNEAELARIQEGAVRANRNHEAAQRVKDAEVDRWYAEAQARTNNALAEFQDSAADLKRGQPAAEGTASPEAAASQRAQNLATLDNEIELQRQRGNDAAVLALLNLRARLQGG